MCSYCGCESITVIGRFMAEHEAVIDACGDLRRACSGGPLGMTSAARRLTALLRPHTAAEEAGLFALLGEDPEFRDHVATLCDEHQALEDALAAVATGDVARMPAFELALRRHIDREENGLFPAAAVRFAGPEWDQVVLLTPAAGPPA